jgi:hypothetical protein
MTDNTPDHETEASEEVRSHEHDLLDLIAAKADRKRHVVERLHGVEPTNHQENEHDD